jgi:hypothetical protein
MLFIIIGSTALGGPWPPQANVASDFCPGQRSTSSYSPAFFLLPPRHQSILISVGHVLVDLAFVRNIFLGHSFSSIRATWPAHFNLLYLIALTIFGSL